MPKALGILNHKPISVRQHLQMFLLGLVNQNRSNRGGSGGGPKILVCDKTIFFRFFAKSIRQGGEGRGGPKILVRDFTKKRLFRAGGDRFKKYKHRYKSIYRGGGICPPPSLFGGDIIIAFCPPSRGKEKYFFIVNSSLIGPNLGKILYRPLETYVYCVAIV